MRLGKPVAVGIGAAVIISGLVIASGLSTRGPDAPRRAEPPRAAAPDRSAMAALATRPTEATAPVESKPEPLMPLEQARATAAARRHYLAALFYDPDAPNDRKARDGLAKAVAATHEDRMEVFDVPVTDPKHQATVRRLGVIKTPLVLVFAPTGAVTHFFHTFDDVGSELTKAILSPKTEEIIAGLQQRKVVFVHVPGPKQAVDPQSQTALDGVTQVLSATATAVYVQADSPEEHGLLREKLGIDLQKEPPVTVVLAPDGRVVEKMPGRLTRRSLLEAYRKVLVLKSGCGGMGSGPGGGTCQ